MCYSFTFLFDSFVVYVVVAISYLYFCMFLYTLFTKIKYVGGINLKVLLWL